MFPGPCKHPGLVLGLHGSIHIGVIPWHRGTAHVAKYTCTIMHAMFGKQVLVGPHHCHYEPVHW